MRIWKIILLLKLILITQSAIGQTNCDTISYQMLLGNSFYCNWTFIEIPDTVSGVIIEHNKASVSCGILATASVSIMSIGNDTIRILDLCNIKEIEKGRNVIIVKATASDFQVHLPYYVLENEIRNKTVTYRTNDFDETILKTAWGQIIEQPSLYLDSDSQAVLITPEINPVFPGGEKEMYYFIEQNINKSLLSTIDTSGQIFAQFKVDTFGNLMDIKILKSLDKTADNEFLRILNLMPKWDPGSIYGKPIEVEMILPLRIPYEEKNYR
jgi:hypothetical protein